jgi:hypothetical protein
MKNNTFQLIDFDRVIFDTALLITKMMDEMKHESPEVALDLAHRFEAAYSKEDTFFVLKFLRDTRGQEWLDAIVATVVQKYGAELFMLPGARERLAGADALTTRRPSFGILTYGDATDQYMKIRMVGIESVPIHLTDTPDKSEIIQSWKQTDGTFLLPDDFGGGVVSTLTFEDDKLRAFSQLPEGVIGVWITRRDDASLRLLETNPHNLHIAGDLHESLQFLKETLTP